MMIKNRKIIEDDWMITRLGEDEVPLQVKVAAGRVIVPLAVWLAQRDTLINRDEIGVWLANDECVGSLKDDVAKFAVIAVEFPKFGDGRGYSIAYLLRERLGFGGELRAMGDVLRDQMFYMQRVGFNAFMPRADRDINEALKSLNDFSDVYQASADQKLPLFRRVQRRGG
ncbi:MAG: DUF934 domain-containing protein [Gallionella sp.]